MIEVTGCLVPGCANTSSPNCKGMCNKCKGEANKLVESGKTTWEELGELGFVEVAQTPLSLALKTAREKHATAN